MKSERQLIELLATLLAGHRMREILQAAFGHTGEYRVLDNLCAAARPMSLIEIARSSREGRSSVVSYVKGGRRYEGVLRGALNRLVERRMIECVEAHGRIRYRLNKSDFNASLLREIMVTRPAPT